jgi:hypothetical protein
LYELAPSTAFSPHCPVGFFFSGTPNGFPALCKAGRPSRSRPSASHRGLNPCPGHQAHTAGAVLPSFFEFVVLCRSACCARVGVCLRREPLWIQPCKLMGLEAQPSFLSLSRARRRRDGAAAIVCPRVSLLGVSLLRVLALTWLCFPSCPYMWPDVVVKLPSVNAKRNRPLQCTRVT